MVETAEKKVGEDEVIYTPLSEEQFRELLAAAYARFSIDSGAGIVIKK